MVRPKGFTLIELLIVMVILALLLSIAVPRFLGQVGKASEAVLRQDLAVMRDAIDKHFADTGRYPGSLEELVSSQYMRKVPVDPISNRADSWVLVAPANKELGTVFDVKSGAAGKAKDGSDYATW